MLSRMLKAGPNMDVGDWTRGVTMPTSWINHTTTEAADSRLALQFVRGLASFSKSHWRALIAEWGLPIDVPDHYSVRDTLGKVCSYVVTHPESVEKIMSTPNKKSAPSPELARVLSILLGNQKRPAVQNDTQAGTKEEKKGEDKKQ